VSGFPTASITDLFRLKQGTYLRSEEMSEVRTESFPFLVYGANGVIGYASKKMYAERLPLISCRGANCGVTHFTLPNSWISNNSIACIPKDVADPAYYFYLFKDSSFNDVITGSAQPQITITNLSTKRLLAPPIAIQRRIASILSAYDDLIANNTRRIAILEEMARRIYEEWFVRFRFPGHEGVRTVESELGLVPEGWSVKTLQDIATITMGLSPKGDTYNEDANGTPLINGPVEFGERFTKRVKWTTAPTKFCEDGDLVVCVRGSTTGKYVKSDGVYCLGRGVCAIRSKFQGFVDQVFEHQLPALLGQVGGSTFPSWTGPQLKLHPVLVPTGKLLARFEAHAGPMRDAVRAYSRQIDNLRTARDLLLPKLISGELDVSAMPEPEALAA
jgi:type I restriction enzyme S subunit